MIPNIGPKILLELDLPQVAIDNDKEFDWNPDHEDTPFDGMGLGAEQMNNTSSSLTSLPDEGLGTPQQATTSTERSDTDPGRREPLKHADQDSNRNRETEQTSREGEKRMAGGEKVDDSASKTNTQNRDNLKLQQALRTAQRAQKAAIKAGMQSGNSEEGIQKTQNIRSGKVAATQLQDKTENSPDAIRLAQTALRARKGEAAAAKRMSQITQAISKAARSMMDQQASGSKVDTSSMDGLSNMTLGETTNLSNNQQHQQVLTAKAAAPANPMADFNEWMKLVQTDDSGDAVLRLQDTEAGSLEVRVRVDGKDLFVALRAEDAAMREQMLQDLKEVQRQLANEELVEGTVHVGEFGTSGGESQLDQNTSQESTPDNQQGLNQTNKTRNTMSQSETVETSTEIGKLHVVA